MLDTIAALALCVQVSDYAAFHLSYHPEQETASDALYAQSEDWAVALSRLVPDADGYITALHDADKIAHGYDGARLLAELERCQSADAGEDAPGGKG